MKVVLYYGEPQVIEVSYDVLEVVPSFIKEVPQDVLDRHDKAVAEYYAVQRILELYKNEG